jgi:hypothetical protein
MKNLLKCSVCALALAGATSVMAQPQAGDWEFTLGGGGSSDQDFDRGGFGVDGSFGYFMTQNFEVAVRQNVNFAAQTDDEEWSGSTRLAADWHFVLGQFVPFIGANIGLVYNEDASAWGAGPEVGFKYYVHERTFVFAMGEYRWFFDDFDDIEDNSDDGSFAFTVGIGFNIGGR